MIKIIKYEDKYRERWSAFVNKAASSMIAHQIGWLDVMQKGLGHKPKYLLAINDDKVTGVLPLILLKTFWGTCYTISLPWIDYGGICADDHETEKLLLDAAKRITDSEKAEFMELRSVEAGNQDLTIRDDKVTFLLRLEKDSEGILKSFNAKLRNQIRKSQKSELTVEFGGLEQLPDFYEIFSWKMHDLGTPVWSYTFFETILKTFPTAAEIIIIKKDGKAIAGGLVLAFKGRLYVPSAAAYRSALRYCPNHALYWEVIKRGCAEGYKYFDFGRSKIDSSTFKFKQQWVPTPTSLAWQYYLARAKNMPSINPSNPKYKLFINIWRKLPLRVANYLGPKIIKNFP